MQQADKEKFVATLKGLAAIKPGVKLTEKSYELYWLALQDWPLEDFVRAAVHLASACEYMPNPYHFDQLRKAGKPTAGESWSRVLEFARGAWRPSGAHLRDPRVEFDSATLRTVEAIGGFQAIAMSSQSSTPFLEKRFAENYDALQGVQDTRESLPPQITAGGKEPKLCGPKKAGDLLRSIGGRLDS